ncbi:hypothetical protein SELMODRAFT_449216 [Selaginella moellendorffii]|uniref:Uncharacterized protein n=1 Tax=Selaginella moellendorffii TaxID=88036 RepID=D8TDS5_SELML|nr:uncharacterized protein LOC9638467 [Selaginella moellendorffii]EFJ05181.1 hypothetical protein SELMODRAFT_449216 [Selaginella moellendorffii]|eukprot:XP_002993762.1 uncharacterized protein LOC9638467 [Selaginella moellendorffii]
MGATNPTGSMLVLEDFPSHAGKPFGNDEIIGMGMALSPGHSKQPQQQLDEDFKQEHQDDQFEELKIQDYVSDTPPFTYNLEEFRSQKYYLFNAGAHDLMINSLLESTNPSALEISAADPTFQPLPWQNKRGITFTCAIEDRWRDFKAKLGVKIDASRKRFLFHKRDASRYIPHSGQWLEIVKGCHIDAAERHWGRNLTKHQITKRWMYGERNHGIPEAFVDAFIDSCGCCRREQIPVAPPPPLPSRKRKLGGKKLNTSTLFDVQFIKQKLDEIAQQVAAAAQLDRGAGLKHPKRFVEGGGPSSAEFEKIDEDEQTKLKEKITAIRNQMDSMLVHLPSMSRGNFLHFLGAMDEALTELRNPALDRQALAAKLPTIEQHPIEIEKPKESSKPTKRVKWKDISS